MEEPETIKSKKNEGERPQMRKGFKAINNGNDALFFFPGNPFLGESAPLDLSLSNL